MADTFRIFKFEKPLLYHSGDVMDTHGITRAVKHRGNFIGSNEIIFANYQNCPANCIGGCPLLSFEQGKYRLSECLITWSEFLVQGGFPVMLGAFGTMWGGLPDGVGALCLLYRDRIKTGLNRIVLPSSRCAVNVYTIALVAPSDWRKFPG